MPRGPVHSRPPADGHTINAGLMAAIVDNALDCIVTIDQDGSIIEFNRAAQATFGYNRADVLQRSMAELIVPPEMRAQHAAGFLRYLTTGEKRMLGRRVETMAWDAGGRRFPVELTITEVPVNGTRLFTAHLRDLTETRRQAEEIERQRQTLFQTEKVAALGSLLAGVAHELNNPLSVVVGRATMLAEECDDDRQRDSLERLNRAAERCARIVQSFLALARRQPRPPAPVDIEAVLRNALDLLGFETRAGGIKLECRIEPGLPRVVGDADQLHQVFANLMVNAQQALRQEPPPRTLAIEARRDGDRVRIEIADNGPGVPAAIRERIFEAFFTTKPPGDGTGLGLAICHGILADHGGEIRVADRPGGGALFAVTLPVAEISATQEADARADASAPARARLLIVDDDPEILAVLAGLLERDGYTVLAARGGVDGLEQARHGNVDLVITDDRMPDLDGRALYEELVRIGSPLAHRFVLMTGDSLGGDLGAFLRSTRLRCLHKPILAPDLRATVRDLLRSPAPR